MFSLIDGIRSDLKKNNIQLVDRICFLIDVKKELYETYLDKGFINGNGNLLSVDQLLDLCVYLKDSYPYTGLKVLNTLLKIESGILKNTPNDFVFPNEVALFLEETLCSLQLPSIETNTGLIDIGEWVGEDIPNAKSKDIGSFQEPLSITFVIWNETVGKAYSYVLCKNNIKPIDVIKVVQKINLKRKIFNFLPSFLRVLIIKVLRKNYNEKSYVNTGDLEVFHEGCQLQKIFKSFDFHFKPFKKLKFVYANNINEAKMIEAMREGDSSALLFSGGGIVRQNTFSSVRKKFIHMHPGLLPQVRGADCFFWSVLLDGFPSCSAMYQNAGIDTGEVLHEESFKLPRFNKKFIANLKDTHSLNDFFEIIYRSILNYYDPMMRAITLSAILEKASGSQDLNSRDISKLPVREQSDNEGRNYHFMHPRLRNKVIELLLEKQGEV